MYKLLSLTRSIVYEGFSVAPGARPWHLRLKKKALLLDAKVGKLVVDIIPVQEPGSGLRIWGGSNESSTCSCIKP